jgi:hypothetical protein
VANVLTVAGTTYSQLQRKANSLIVDGWGWDYDGDYWLDFHEYIALEQPKFSGPRAVSWSDSGTTRFVGDISNVQPDWSDEGRTWCYHCLGLKNRANQFPITAIDASGVIAYNLPADSEDYIPSNSGLSVGTIISNLLTAHSSALSAVGITTDATTASQLAALTLVPTDPVYISGERYWLAQETVLQRWARNIRSVILPSGLVRFIDITTGAAHTLTLGVDPVDPPLFSRDWTHCATRIQARGKGIIAPAYLQMTLSGGTYGTNDTLKRTWTNTDEANWKMSDFTKPGDAYDTGTVTTVNSATTVTVQSSDAARTWVVNFWNQRQAWIHLWKNTSLGLSYMESRPVTAAAAMSAGGTALITLGYPLDNSGSTAYDHYSLVGTVAPIATGRNNVYRLLNVVTPGNWIENHLVKRAPVAMAFVGLNNASAQLTTTPACIITLNGTGGSWPFRIIPQGVQNTTGPVIGGQILFDRPYVELFNQPSVLAAGGSGVVRPDLIYMMLFYSRGALLATYPPDVAGVPQYAGTAFSAGGLQRTNTVDVESWLYQGNQSAMVSLATMIHQSVKDTVMEGNVQFKGAYSTVYDPSGGHRLNFAGAALGGTPWVTGDESLNIPVRAVTVQYQTGGGGLLVRTTMRCSTRRDPRTDEGFFQHLSVLGSGAGPFREGMNVFGIPGGNAYQAQQAEMEERMKAGQRFAAGRLEEGRQPRDTSPEGTMAGLGEAAAGSFGGGEEGNGQGYGFQRVGQGVNMYGRRPRRRRRPRPRKSPREWRIPPGQGPNVGPNVEPSGGDDDLPEFGGEYGGTNPGDIPR